MLSTGKMTRKIVFISAHVATDVALEWVFETMTAHVDRKEYIIGEMHIAMQTFL